MTVDWVPANTGVSFNSGCMGSLGSCQCLRLVLAANTAEKLSPQPQQVAGKLTEERGREVKSEAHPWGGGEGILCMMISWTERRRGRETLGKTPRSQLGGVGSQVFQSAVCGFGKGNCLRRPQPVAGPAGCLQVYS